MSEFMKSIWKDNTRNSSLGRKGITWVFVGPLKNLLGHPPFQDDNIIQPNKSKIKTSEADITMKTAIV